MGNKISWQEQAKQKRLFWEGKFKEHELNHGEKSYKEFCRMQNLNYAQWIYWRKRLKDITKSQATVVKKSASVSFMPVVLPKVKSPIQNEIIELHYGKHYRFMLPVEISDAHLLRLLKVLGECHVDAAIRN